MRDARGKRVRFQRTPAIEEVLDDDALQLGFTLVLNELGLLAAFLAVGLIATGLGTLIGLPSGVLGWVLFIGGTLVMVVLMAFAIAFIAGWFGGRSRRVKGMLARLACPGCGYGLGEIGKDSDGCTVCPECGAAWRVRSHDG